MPIARGSTNGSAGSRSRASSGRVRGRAARYALGALLLGAAAARGAGGIPDLLAPQPVLKPGDPAPPFHLETAFGEKRSLEDFRGHPLVLLFQRGTW